MGGDLLLGRWLWTRVWAVGVRVLDVEHHVLVRCVGELRALVRVWVWVRSAWECEERGWREEAGLQWRDYKSAQRAISGVH